MVISRSGECSQFYFLLRVKRSPVHRNFRRVNWNHFYKLPVPGAYAEKCQQFFPPAKTSLFLFPPFFLCSYSSPHSWSSSTCPPTLCEAIVVDNSPISFVCMWMLSFPSPSGWKKTVLSLLGLAPWSKIIRPYIGRLISGLSDLFHQSICLSVCQCTAVVTIVL